MRPLLVAGLLFAVALAGCAGGGGTAGPVSDPSDLDQGKGAILGLLVDDRFRPIQLVDEPRTEFQAEGFILLQETGAESRTNKNGEFRFVNLEPGQYTLRTSASGHEARPQKVVVVAAEFTETEVEARRIATDEDIIITEAYTAFVPCMLNAPIITAQCIIVPPDLSGNTNREGFIVDHRGFDSRFEVIEMYVNREAETNGAMKIVGRNTSNADNYVINDVITDGHYLRVWLQNGTRSPFDVESRNVIWANEEPTLIQLWAQGLLKEETQPLCPGTCDSRGIGPQFGVLANFLVSAFLYEPSQTEIDTYCGICS